MRIKKHAIQCVGTIVLLISAFVIGLSPNEFRRHKALAQVAVAAIPPAPEQTVPTRIPTGIGNTKKYTPYQMYADVLTTLQSNYYGDRIDTTQMTYNGIRGMLYTLNDRYTRFLDPKAYSSMLEDNSGEIVGIGVMLGTNNKEQVYVAQVKPNSPAYHSKVMAGDIILKIDKRPVTNLTRDEVIYLISGKPNTKVTLTLRRKSYHKPVVISILRSVIVSEVVHYQMIDPAHKIGYIHLTEFNDLSDNQIGIALDVLQKKDAKAIILDLRDNPGGLLDAAQKTASRFIPNGIVVWIKDFNGGMQKLNTIPSIPKVKQPVVVLVNKHSASASEILSGAIKDNGAGLLIGEKTFGKGVVQTIMPLRDGSAVAITTQHYYTSKMHDINHIGIQPDIEVVISDDNQRKLIAFTKKHPEIICDIGDDQQLQRAITEAIQRAAH